MFIFFENCHNESKEFQKNSIFLTKQTNKYFAFILRKGMAFRSYLKPICRSMAYEKKVNAVRKYANMYNTIFHSYHQQHNG